MKISFVENTATNYDLNPNVNWQSSVIYISIENNWLSVFRDIICNHKFM